MNNFADEFDSLHLSRYHFSDPLWIAERRGKEKIALVLTAFGDESHDEQNTRVFAVAGLLGNAEEWKYVVDQWQLRTGGRIFHAADCESDRGDFTGQSHDENLSLFRDLTQIVASSQLRGFGAAVDLGGYAEYFPEPVAELPYYRCFWTVLVHFAEQASLRKEKVHFAFDRRHQIEFNAAALYEFMANLKEWKNHAYLHSDISFVCRETIEIQVADLLARETMKHFDNIVGPDKRLTRRSMDALLNTDRFNFVFYTRKHFQKFRQKVDQLDSGAAERERYHAWRHDLNLPDTFSNRLRYLIALGPDEAVASLEPERRKQDQ